MKNELLERITNESRQVYQQAELLLTTSVKDVISFVCKDMDKKHAARLRGAFEMLENYRREKEFAKESGIPSIRMVKYAPCLELLESERMHEVYDFYLSQKSELQAMERREQMWMDFVNTLRRNETAEVIAAGETQSVLVFSTENTIPAKYRWRMKLYKPSRPMDMLPITVETPAGKPVNGKLFFCANELAVENGKTAIPYKEAIKQSANANEIVFMFEDGSKIPGYPEY